MPDTFLAFDVVDVFAESPFAGNQLAVVHGTEGLDDEQLLVLAREFNFSETTFPVPVTGARYRCRIFTPGGEIPFAGHPTLGTAWVLRERDELDPPEVTPEVTQVCGAGEIGVRLNGRHVELTATPGDLIGPLDEGTVAALLVELGLQPEDRTGDAWLAGTGLTFVHVPVRADAVARASVARTLPDLPATRDPLGGINPYSVTDDLQVHSRVFCPDVAVPEDAATGSAAAGLGMALRARGLAGDGDRYRIRQGIEMGRPSVLLGTVGAHGISVAGQVHPIARGEIRVP